MSDLLVTCSRDLMEITPQIVQLIRIEMRSGRGDDLTIPQFRTLRYVQKNPDTSLNSLADHLGLTPPSVSKLVDGLVKQDLITRRESPIDRRKLTLVLTNNGEEIVNRARSKAQERLAEKMSLLSEPDLNTIHHAMELLSTYFLS